MKKRGWLSSEVVLVLIVIMIVLSAASYGYSSYITGSRSAATRATTAKLHGAIAQYHYEMQQYPDSLAALNSASGNYGPWVTEAIPSVDPFGNAYNYHHTTTGFAIWSNGPNGSNQSGSGVPTSLGGDDIGYIGK